MRSAGIASRVTSVYPAAPNAAKASRSAGVTCVFPAKYATSAPDVTGPQEGLARFYDDLIARVNDMPGVVSSGAVSVLPLQGIGSRLTTAIDEFPAPEDEFPPLPKFEGAKVVTMRQKDLRDGLRKTSYAISTDETRYVLNGVLFSFKDNKLTLVATDGRRLAMAEIELEFPRSHESDLIIPTKAVTELQRLLTDDGDVKVSMSNGQIAFDLNKTLLVSKLIEGNYPNYRQVIPGEAKERVKLEREMFLNSLRRVSLLASDKSHSVKLNFSKNNLDITANTAGVGEAKESLAVPYKGREFSIAFNPEFLMAPLRALTEDEVFLDLIDEMSPGVLKIQTPFLYVLMPMRISS